MRGDATAGTNDGAVDTGDRADDETGDVGHIDDESLHARWGEPPLSKLKTRWRLLLSPLAWSWTDADAVLMKVLLDHEELSVRDKKSSTRFESLSLEDASSSEPDASVVSALAQSKCGLSSVAALRGIGRYGEILRSNSSFSVRCFR